MSHEMKSLRAATRHALGQTLEWLRQEVEIATGEVAAAEEMLARAKARKAAAEKSIEEIQLDLSGEE